MPQFKTVSTALYTFSGENNTQWNVMSASVLLALIPTLVLYFLLQKYIYSGVTNGAVKG
jgi:multiple sugar transport system permease protein